MSNRKFYQRAARFPALARAVLQAPAGRGGAIRQAWRNVL
jgi:hypothetical protein